MDNMLLVGNSRYLFNSNKLDINFIENIIDCNTSIIYFCDTFDADNPIFKLFVNKRYG